MDRNKRNPRVKATMRAYFNANGVNELDPTEVIQALEPRLIAEYLGYNYKEVDIILSSYQAKEIAGEIDFGAKTIRVSKVFPTDQRRFTGMHEVIHAILHSERAAESKLLRDRRDSVSMTREDSNDTIETEANRNASIELMPDVTVIDVFGQLFHVPHGNKLVIDEYAATNLNKDIDELAALTLDQKYSLIASTGFYRRPIKPIHQVFKVSADAMAIRLEMLDLLEDIPRGTPNLRIVS